ncbi:MAG: hypothetical protein JXX29_20295 [Deltaproteobacteria bacterium]|nr:hypothetical protein [Deltaproteobacteria bacterium]MBN2674034.1 hypothetical protein [Deltaproteobacteria bacterium]
MKNHHRLIWLCALSLVLATSCSTRDISLLHSSGGSGSSNDSDSMTDTHSGVVDSDISSDSGSAAQACELTDQTVRVTAFETTVEVNANESEEDLLPVVISAVPGGGSRVAWMGGDGMVHITTLNSSDTSVGDDILVAANDFQDLYATADGGVLLLTRDALGGGTLNCGDPADLCSIPDPPVPCYDSYLVRFTMAGEQWALKLTESSIEQPPYSTNYMHFVWWYAHHGRIASNGDSYAAYFATALSTASGSCFDIVQTDRMQIVGNDGALLEGGFNFGCSWSGYERVVWNATANAYVAVCQTAIGGNGAIAFSLDKSVIQNVDLWYSNVSELVAVPVGYWIASSVRREDQPENQDGLADVNLFHFTSMTPDISILVEGTASQNVRAPHLALHGSSRLLLGYEVGTAAGHLSPTDDRRMYLQFHDAETGQQLGERFPVNDVVGNRYQAFRSFPDGSVAYPFVGDTGTSIKIMRVLPCTE